MKKRNKISRIKENHTVGKQVDTEFSQDSKINNMTIGMT
jgi:hypothetical protein